MLESKSKQFQSIVKSIDSDNEVEPGDFVQRQADLTSRFDRVSNDAQDWHMVSTKY